MNPRSELLLAEFLDGPSARALGRRDEVRRAASLVVGACFDDLGIEPRLLDGDQLRELMFGVVARRLGSKDSSIPLLPRVTRALIEHLGQTALVPNAFELESALDDVDAEFESRVKAVPDGQRAGGKVDPIVNRGSKVGRNDPCPCGSGKKFKQCCQRLGEA